jgi:hypothetical protein
MQSQPIDTQAGTLDGDGAADHDQPFRFGRLPASLAPYPFSTRQYARLLVLRSRVQAGLAGLGDAGAAHRLVLAPARGSNG